jgi:four helix bundle protein
MGKIKSYKDLEIWQLAVKLIVKVYRLLKAFPLEEKFGIIAQIKDAVVSVAANIAESFGRFHYKDKIKFLYNARGSLLEVDSHLSVSKELGFITDKNRELYDEILQDIIRLGVKINNYRTKIQNSSKTT